MCTGEDSERHWRLFVHNWRLFRSNISSIRPTTFVAARSQSVLQAMLRSKLLRSALERVAGHPYECAFDLRLFPEHLADPLRWSNPRMTFVNSMRVLFPEGVSDDYIEPVSDLMSLAPWHVFQVLTKKASRLAAILRGTLRRFAEMRHIWRGVSDENTKHGLPRVGPLQCCPASVRFLSIEPLLEDLGVVDLSGISWVIVGGESGPGARRLDEEWVRSLHDLCKQSDIAFFFKQWGGVRQKEHATVLAVRTHDGFPEIVRNPVPESSA